MRTLVLGYGNPILTDDSVGIKIATKIKETTPGVELIEASAAPMVLIDCVAGYDKVIIIDSIKTRRGKPGALYKLQLEHLKPSPDPSSVHGIDIATAFRLGEGLGYKMPRFVSIYAVEIEDNTTFGEQCTGEIDAKIPLVARQIIQEEKL